MKQKKDYTIIALLIPLFFVLVGSGAFSGCSEVKATDTHVCTDKTHLNCDGGCECDGMECSPINECRYEGRECPNYNNCTGHGIAPRDYQIEVYNDTVWVYDGQRLVERYVTNWKGQIDSVLLNDNQ